MGEGGNTVGDSPVETSLERVEALLEAARYDDIYDLKSLESAGLSLDSKDLHGRTALHMASANGHLQIVEYLISRGVDLNATNEEMNTPLHWACLNGHVEVIKKLILAGANLSVLNSYERTPVDEAVSRGKMDVLDAVNVAAAQVELRDVSVSWCAIEPPNENDL
ncbi:ankyrin repeat-containing protein P16F5.05c-like isoform X2 [Malus sylvestris]|uniref:ankyrin repeat-containing protein P16F5.05c-like isoform X2 n=1 Tax=Malus sylvestris TaxID=3752 RepID=UPI0021AD0CE5|nr:ankyrin repeat-containing protein P16F5.05c-like isoform X2 [Malus sylvestris]